jgi:hypothetical protein
VTFGNWAEDVDGYSIASGIGMMLLDALIYALLTW